MVFYSPKNRTHLKEYVVIELNHAILIFKHREYFKDPPFELDQMTYLRDFTREHSHIEPRQFTIPFTIPQRIIRIKWYQKHCIGSLRK